MIGIVIVVIAIFIIIVPNDLVRIGTVIMVEMCTAFRTLPIIFVLREAGLIF